MKAIQRIPTDQYAYIELEIEYESVEDAFIDHERLLKLHSGGIGLNASEWKKVREHMLNTGESDPNLWDSMNKAQRFWINETKLGIRGLTVQEKTFE
jgi:hypothetical protein